MLLFSALFRILFLFSAPCRILSLSPPSPPFRHIDALKHFVFRECQSLFDVATRPCSVAFDAHRDDSYFNGGEDYITFSGCPVNVGGGMCAKVSIGFLFF